MSRLGRLLCLCVVAVGLPTGAVEPDTEGPDEFGKAAAAALGKVGRFNRDVTLSWWHPPRKDPFVFQGSEVSKFEIVDCELAHEFHIVAQANDQAQFNVGACTRDAVRIRDFAVAAEKANATAFDRLFKNGGMRVDRSALEKMLSYRKVQLRGGMTGYAYSTLLLGHGVALINQAVVYDPARRMAFIVQANVGQLCGHSSPDGKPSIESPFCTNTDKALLDVATDLATRFKAAPK